MAKRKIRIFISSPSDVQYERKIARKVVNELNSIFIKYVQIDLLMWEDFPLTSENTFQEGIDIFLKEERIDFAVFILWSRMGTPLNNNFLKPDGTPYQSGTEYEYDFMRELHRQTGYPRLLTYVKTKEAIPQVRSCDELSKFLFQKESVKTFIEERFHDKETNTNYAYLQFDEETSFESKLHNHLKELIRKELGNISEIKEWNGNPYVGLNSFEPEQEKIFYGRKHLVYDTCSKLLDKNEEKHNLIVLGESGSGKSSFVKAGLLPFLCNDSKREYCIITPSMFTGNVYQGLLNILVEKYRFLQGHPFIEELKNKIDENTNFEYLSYAIQNNPHNEVIIYIDQFEELFNDSRITKDERYKTILLLKGIVSTQSLFLFISMRSDFYSRFSFYEELIHIKEQSLVIDIPSLGVSEISELIEEPAKKACLKWEVNKDGIALNEQIVKEACEIKDLPLIEFALSELYNKRNENDYLTFDAYHEIGGLKGAIVEYVNNIYNQFNEKEQNAFKEFLGFTISISTSHKDTYLRKTTLLKNTPQKEAHQTVINKMTNAHIFVTGKDVEEQPTITIAHEILIRDWDVIKKWIEEQKDFLRSNAYYEHRTKRWLDNNKSSKDIIQGKTALLEAEYFIYKYSNQINNETNNFLQTSLRKDTRKNIGWHIAVNLIWLSIVVGTYMIIATDSEYNWRDFHRNILYAVSGIFILIYPIICYNLILKCTGKPIFKTTKASILFWSIFIPIWIMFFTLQLGGELIISIFFSTPVIIKLISVINETKRRYSWKRKKSVEYNYIDKLLHHSDFILIITIISILGIYYISESDAELKNTTQLTDRLFDGLNNISETHLSPTDKYYINNSRKEYLEKHFSEQIQDSIYDERELQYAISLYHMGLPDRALRFLYWEENWRDHVMVIKCCMSMGYYQAAETFLEDYALSEEKNYFDNGWLNANDLIWTAEKLGRFDLAEKLFMKIYDNNIDTSSPGYDVNKGHIFLAKNEIDTAIQYYQRALKTDTNSINYITRDLHTFSYFDVLDKKLLNGVAKKLNIEFVPAYSQNDTVTTNQIYEKLHGNWIYSDSNNNYLYKLTFDKDDISFARYYLYNTTDSTTMYNQVTHIRFDKTEKGIIWDEYDPITDNNSYGILEEIQEDYFSIRIMENGNKSDYGTTQIYKRLTTE